MEGEDLAHAWFTTHSRALSPLRAKFRFKASLNSLFGVKTLSFTMNLTDTTHPQAELIPNKIKIKGKVRKLLLTITMAKYFPLSKEEEPLVKNIRQKGKALNAFVLELWLIIGMMAILSEWWLYY